MGMQRRCGFTSNCFDRLLLLGRIAVHSIRCSYACSVVGLCLLDTSVIPAKKRTRRSRCRFACGLVGAHCSGSASDTPKERSTFGGRYTLAYLGMPRHAHTQYSQPNSQGAAAMRPLTTSTVATCYWNSSYSGGGGLSTIGV